MSNLAAQKEQLVQYFMQGCKAGDRLTLGVEVEHFITQGDGRPVAFEAAQAVVRELQGPNDVPVSMDGAYTGYTNALYSVALGPACQLKIRIAPRSDIGEILTIYEAFDTALCMVLAGHSMQSHAVGYHPTRRAGNLPLADTLRYQALDRFFSESGVYGSQMMRATASTCISIDYHSERDFVQKYRAVCLLAPLLSLLTDNAPVYQAEPNTAFCVRSRVWQNVDPDRFGIPPALMDADFGFERYADYVLQKPLIVARQDGRSVEVGQIPAAAFYGASLTEEEIRQILSMFFFDARLQKSIEIRVADSMPQSYIAAYAQLIKAIFSSPAAQEGVLRHYAGVTVADIRAAYQSIFDHGYAATVYGHSVTMELAWLLAQAKSRIASSEERRLLAPFSALLASKKTIREEEINHE